METEIVRHVLLLRLRLDTTVDQFLAVMAAFREMAGNIEGIVGFEHGTNNSPEGLNRGLTHVVTLTFASAQARDAYLPHPEHCKFADWVGQLGLIEEVLAFDYSPHN
jgi:Stress responsive A/B Barrel Domain